MSYQLGPISITGSQINSPGDLNFSTSGSIRSIPSSSGDNLGAATLELRPDTSLGSDQYIVLDPTAPSHIHIRAGGNIDNSSAYLYLGGENNNVRVSDYGAVDVSAVNAIRLKVPSYQYEFFDTFNWSGSAEWVDAGGQGQIVFNEPTLNLTELINTFGDYLSISASINSGDPVVVTSWGSGNPSNIYTATPPVTSPTVVTQIEFTMLFENRLRLDPDEGDFDIRVGDYNFIIDSKRDINLYADDDLRLEGTDIVELRNKSVSEPITLVTDYNNSAYTWYFYPNGTTNLPGDLSTNASINATGNSSLTGSFSGSFSGLFNGVVTDYIFTTDIGLPGVGIPPSLIITHGGTYIIPQVYTGTAGDITFPDPQPLLGQKVIIQNRANSNAADIGDNGYRPNDIGGNDISTIAAQTTKTFVAADRTGVGSYAWLEI